MRLASYSTEITRKDLQETLMTDNETVDYERLKAIEADIAVKFAGMKEQSDALLSEIEGTMLTISDLADKWTALNDEYVKQVEEYKNKYGVKLSHHRSNKPKLLSNGLSIPDVLKKTDSWLTDYYGWLKVGGIKD